MSASNEWTEYHLTPKGWVTGTEKTDFNVRERERPADAVQTVKVRDYQSSVFSQVDHTREIVWEAKDSQKIAKLKSKFGEAPDLA
ncbi:hypothetical protein EOA79_04520 [Mesorhizobium sp. M1A.F.Ca.IN.020.03.2.1]|uniref:hypothetical protein n=1 Tax=Mesorhizobium sp. M1A.F.Ca.IN.020.03.2.1 TaxID=2496769 RepID=UPI000FD40D12|nr:hypothetical protein [Mesorhizobium sp. M1A.F.Ca.IN.020.03.2.1]RUV07435.1 hypothetical protein EOA79_04520 [Mesorhizobium sp. M1A.F.Ca.IN.020.03.2.1]